MSKLSGIINKLDLIQQVDPSQLLAECVKDKLNTHLVEYYNRLQRSLDKAYSRVIRDDNLSVLKTTNKCLNKVEGSKDYLEDGDI